MRRRLVALGCVWIGMHAAAAPAQTSKDIQGVAQLVREHYFDPARGREIADVLIERAAADDLDQLKDRKLLAEKLTAILRPHDGHFRVIYEPERTGNDGAGPPRMRPPGDPNDKTHGFRRVERLPGDVLLIELTRVEHIEFANADDPARRAADAALAQVPGAKAVILDLRGNGGGAPSMVGYLISAFVKPGANVYNSFHTRQETLSERPDIEYPRPNVDVPLFVLINKRTASAAESLAFSLQSCGRAKVIGERSAGGANPGRVFRTPQGYSVFVSTGSPRNPINGKNWERTGVLPDVEVKAEESLETAVRLGK